MDTKEECPRSELMTTLGIYMEAKHPRYVAAKDNADGWAHVVSMVTVRRGNRMVWSGEFSQGLACVRLHKGESLDRLTLHMESILKGLGNNNRLDGGNRRWIKPTLADVIYSLLLDGSAYFDAETFDDWCSNFGYDTDSRKAEEMYKACDDTGRKIARAFSTKELEQLRTIFQDY